MKMMKPACSRLKSSRFREFGTSPLSLRRRVSVGPSTVHAESMEALESFNDKREM
jgi:hypothetical protein